MISHKKHHSSTRKRKSKSLIRIPKLIPNSALRSSQNRKLPKLVQHHPRRKPRRLTIDPKNSNSTRNRANKSAFGRAQFDQTYLAHSPPGGARLRTAVRFKKMEKRVQNPRYARKVVQFYPMTPNCRGSE